MMIDYCHIKENLPKYLVQFTREINGKTCKIPILFGRTPINCNDKKDQYWFFGVKPFEADNTVYVLLKDKNNNYYYLRKEEDNTETVYQNLLDAITYENPMNDSQIKNKQLDIIYDCIDLIKFCKSKLDSDWLEVLEYKKQIDKVNKEQNIVVKDKDVNKPENKHNINNIAEDNDINEIKEK